MKVGLEHMFEAKEREWGSGIFFKSRMSKEVRAEVLGGVFTKGECIELRN